MLDQCHCGLHPVSGAGLAARELDETQATKSALPHTVALCQFLHITVKCHENRIIGLGNSANKLVRRARHSSLFEENHFMAGIEKTLANGDGNALVEKKAQLEKFPLNQAARSP